MLHIDALIRDLAVWGADASYDRRSRTLDVSTCEHRPLKAMFGLAIDEREIRRILAYHQAHEGVGKDKAHEYLYTEVLNAVSMYGDEPGPYAFNDRCQVMPSC